jgi:uncharacterized membrane protein YfcA
MKPVVFRQSLERSRGYWRLGAIEMRLGARRIVSAMSAGSLVGAALGGIAVGFAPVVAIKALLGCVLIAAAAKVTVSEGVSRAYVPFLD